MSWSCHLCTYLNPSDLNVCDVCSVGYPLFSTQSSTDIPSASHAINAIPEDGRVSRKLIETADDLYQAAASGPPTRKEDMYIKDDGTLLYGKNAVDERKRAIARRKALDIKKQWEAMSGKRPNPKKFSTRYLKLRGEKTTAGCFASQSTGHFNALNANAAGAHASATATAETVSASALNANVTGANASAAASANVVRANVGNMNVTGVNTSASATADAVKVAVGNVNVTGAEVAASASASLAKVNVGNVSVTGASAGASASVNGTGVSAFNVSISGASVAASANVDGSLSFGNVCLGLNPSFDIGFGFNIGIPFLNGGGGSSGGGKGGKGGQGEKSADGGDSAAKPRGLEGVQKYLSDKFPNQRHHLKEDKWSIVPNTSGQPIDPLLPDKDVPRTDRETAQVRTAVERHDELVSGGHKFVGFRGGPRRDADGNLVKPPASNATSSAPPSSNPEWAGMYASPSPAVASAYAVDNDTAEIGQIDRVYLPRDAANSYYTPVGLNTRVGLQALRDAREHSNGRYIFSGPQHETQHDLRAPETVIAPAVRDKAFQSKTIRFVPSAHEQRDPEDKLYEIFDKEMASSCIVPDYLVRPPKTAADCARDGGRERLAHTFDGRPPYLYETQPTEDEKLLMEECRRLGMDISASELHDWTKNLRSHEHYEREEDERMRRAQNGSGAGGAGDPSGKAKTEQEEEEEEEESDKPPEPCKDHPPHIRCMKCLQNTSGARIRNIHGRIHGFKFN